jgi:hypothetical protein
MPLAHSVGGRLERILISWQKSGREQWGLRAPHKGHRRSGHRRAPYSRAAFQSSKITMPRITRAKAAYMAMVISKASGSSTAS